MDEYYIKKDKKTFSRDAIIGLGEESFRKNYYPELQEKIIDLERINARNRAIMSTIPDIMLVSDLQGGIGPFIRSAEDGNIIEKELLENRRIMNFLKDAVGELSENHPFLTKEFQMEIGREAYYFEARFHRSETQEILIMIRNMTDRILLEHKLRDMVERDSLTNLYNRRKFEEEMDFYSGKDIEKITIISIDVNGLKFINDTLGHMNGDQVIVDAAKIVVEVFGDKGNVARIGGDEFGIILENYKAEQVERMLEQLTSEVEQHNFMAKGHGLSLAFGYSFHENGIVNMEYLFQEADNNMYQNKLLKKESIRGTFVKTFMKALEAKDFVSEGHVMRMERLAVLIGKALALHSDQMDRIVLLTKFHDIGKIGIPDSILKKNGSLNEDEWKVMRTHTNIGERIALEAIEIRDIAHLILKHHEKWDGTGYPLGLKGDEIPVECRILAITDTFDAMTNDRPYRRALPVEEAAKEIEKCAGTQFDPELVKIFTTLYKDLVDES